MLLGVLVCTCFAKFNCFFKFWSVDIWVRVTGSFFVHSVPRPNTWNRTPPPSPKLIEPNLWNLTPRRKICLTEPNLWNLPPPPGQKKIDRTEPMEPLPPTQKICLSNLWNRTPPLPKHLELKPPPQTPRTEHPPPPKHLQRKIWANRAYGTYLPPCGVSTNTQAMRVPRMESLMYSNTRDGLCLCSAARYPFVSVGTCCLYSKLSVRLSLKTAILAYVGLCSLCKGVTSF